MPRPMAPNREAFLHFETLQTRWNDNDLYGHVNNAVYYFFFDTLVNNYLIKHKLLHIEDSPIIGLVAETLCQYFAPLTYPHNIEAGLSVQNIGTSSVTYRIGLFAPGQESAAAAGHFVHVYVDAYNRRPKPLTDNFKAALRPLLRP